MFIIHYMKLIQDSAIFDYFWRAVRLRADLLPANMFFIAMWSNGLHVFSLNICVIVAVVCIDVNHITHSKEGKRRRFPVIAIAIVYST